MHSLLYRFFIWLHWAIMNCVRNTQMENTGISRHAKIGTRAIARACIKVGPDVVLGDLSYISGLPWYAEVARISEFCSIGRQVFIGPDDYDQADASTHPFRLSPTYGDLGKSSISLKRKSAADDR